MVSIQLELPDTLAQRVQVLRDRLDLTPRALAQKAMVPLSLIEDLEGGLVMFLSVPVRQKLARALRVRAAVLQDVEKRPPAWDASQPIPLDLKDRLLADALNDPDRELHCPACAAPLRIKAYDRRDLDDNPVIAVKITCTRCLFRMDKD